jgi:hypothetical protein
LLGHCCCQASYCCCLLSLNLPLLLLLLLCNSLLSSLLQLSLFILLPQLLYHGNNKVVSFLSWLTGGTAACIGWCVPPPKTLLQSVMLYDHQPSRLAVFSPGGGVRAAAEGQRHRPVSRQEISTQVSRQMTVNDTWHICNNDLSCYQLDLQRACCCRKWWIENKLKTVAENC